jgi:hypothetical protein
MVIRFTCRSESYYVNQILAELPEPGTGLNNAILVAARKLKEWLNWSWQQTFDALLPVVNKVRGCACSQEVKRQVDSEVTGGAPLRSATPSLQSELLEHGPANFHSPNLGREA